MQSNIVLYSLLVALIAGCSGLTGQEIAFDSHEISALNFDGRNRTVNNRSDAELLARAIHDEVNRVRTEHGLRALEWGPRLSDIAVRHSQDMGLRGYFEHDSPEGHDFADRYRQADYSCQVPTGGRRILLGGENLFLTHRAEMLREHEDGRQEHVNLFTINQLADRIVSGWMNSRGHRRNLLQGAWRREGIGIAVTVTGQIFVTQNFC